VNTFDVYPIVPGQPEAAKSLTPTKSGWNSYDIDLATIGTTGLNNIIQFKFVSTPFGGTKVYLDNIYFYKTATVVTNAPTTAAPTPPERNAADVISLFSGAYTDLAGTDWFPNWGQSTIVTDTTIVGNATKKYENFNYQGVQFLNPIDASGMTTLHLDIWTPDVNTFDVYPIVPGQPEAAKSLTPTKSGWNSYDIDLATIGTTGLNNIIQFKFVSTPFGGTKAYLDNIYFYKPEGTFIGIAPTVNITSPANNAQFVAPASVTINADAGDADGTVTNVKFYSGADSIGIDETAPYSFEWTNVGAGNYSITAKVSDNDGNVVASTPVAVSVKPVACTGTAISGDYSYEVYTQAGTVYYTFHPLTPIIGCTYSILHLIEGGGGDNGYGMTASGSDFIYSKAIANGVNTSFYFTYNTPPAGERNSSADPHAYFVGTACVAGAPTVSITSPLEAANFTAPASIIINANAEDDDGTVSKVDFYNGADLIGSDDTAPYSFEWTNVVAGSYALIAKATDNSDLTTASTPINVIVNEPNLNGFCGTAFNGDYEYKAETVNGIVTFRFHPLTPIQGCLYATINLTVNGAPDNSIMLPSGSDFIYSRPIADGVIASFYFTYQTPPAGERNSSAHKHAYTVGTNCLGITGTTPIVSLDSSLSTDIFTEPESITINATDIDNDGTVSKVEFYNGATLLGMDDTSPYNFNWTNVPAGNYLISAWATDNDGYTSISNLVNIVVNINNADGFCGTLANGDYSYKVETINGNVVVTFHPLAPILGCNSSLIYLREGLYGNYPGYGMTKIGTDFRFTKAIANGTPISIYFTYNTPIEGGERNSSATPHSYTVGDVCLGVAPTVSITSPANAASFLEPANITITANAADENGTVTKVDFYNGETLLGTDDTAPYSLVWNNVLAGSYIIKAKATDNSDLVTTAAPVNITVNIPNTNGYCGTAVSGDYEWKAETVEGNVTFTFHPLAPIAGSNLAIIFIQENGGGFPGYTMTASGTDFVFTRAIANGTSLSIYFTYNTPPAGERNSSANPHSYTVGDDCVGTLPISLLSFSAAVQTDGSVAVSWSTATEQNNDHFLIEKSNDGRNYTMVAKVAAGKNPNTKNDYKVLDQYPVNGLNYYRLVQVDKDGRSVLSGVRTVNVNKKNAGISMYPNPLKGTIINIKLPVPSANKLNVQLLNMAGKIIYSGTYIPQGDLLQVTLPAKPAAGVYLMKVEGNAPLKLVVN
jgi:hypothetical protein